MTESIITAYRRVFGRNKLLDEVRASHDCLLKVQDLLLEIEQRQAEGEVRMAGWFAVTQNRQRDLEASLDIVELSLSRLTNQREDGTKSSDIDDKLKTIVDDVERLKLSVSVSLEPGTKNNQ